MSELGTAYMSIVPKVDKSSMSSATSEIQSGLEASGESSGNSFGTFFQTAAGTFVGNMAVKLAEAATDGIKQIVAGAYDAYGEYEQLVGGMDTLYGDSSQTMQRYAANAFNTAQMSANDYMDLATSFAASLTSSLGGDTAAAAEAANLAITDMADNANKMGTSMEDIENAYKGFSKQNYTMLDNLKLGYGGTKSEMERLLEDAEKIKAANGEVADYSIDSYADMVEAIHVVQENMGITGTTAEEAATTVQGSTAMMQAAWENWLTSLGTGDSEAIGTSFADLVDSLETMLSNAIPLVANIFTGIGETVGGAIYDACPPQVQAMIDDVLELLEGIGEALAPVIEPLQETIGAALDYIEEKVGAKLDVIKEVWDAVWPPLSETVTTVFEAIGPIIEAALEVITGILQTVTAFISGDWDGVWQGMEATLESVWTLIQSVVEGAINVVSSVISGVINGIVNIWNTGWGILSSVVDTVLSGIQSVISGGLDGVVSWFSGLPGRILSALGDVGSLLYNAGSSIISGFLDGLKSMWDSVTSFVGGIADWIAQHKGPISYDRTLLIPHGKAIMQSLYGGLETGWGDVTDLVGGMAGEISDAFSGGIDARVTASAGNLALAGAASATASATPGTSASDGILAKLDSIAERLGNAETAIYVDGKKLASTIARPMNQQLGVLAARGC